MWQTDLDCVLVPKCNNDRLVQKNAPVGFLSLNKVTAEVYYNVDYYEKCGPPKCYDKCRCDNMESQKKEEKTDPKTGKKQVYWEQFSAVCIGRRCELRSKVFKEEIVDPVGKTVKPVVSDFSKEVGKSSSPVDTSSGSIQ